MQSGDRGVLRANRRAHLYESVWSVQIVLKGGWRNEIAYRMIPELDIPIMRTWNETVPIHFLHHHYNDHCGDA